MKKNLTSGSESDEEERILGSETLSTSLRELSDISDSPVLHTVDTSTSRYGRKNTGLPASETVTCHGRTRRKKKERVNESDE